MKTAATVISSALAVSFFLLISMPGRTQADQQADATELVQEPEAPAVTEIVLPEGYYKPLDGRYAFGTLFPLVNAYTAVNNPGILDETPFADDAHGYTVIEAVVNGEPVAAFSDDDIGKEFVLLWGHRNPAQIDYERVDEFPPLEVSSRYSKIVYRISPSRVVVNFAYNGGNSDEPVDLNNWKARIFHDSSDDWQAFGEELNRDDTPDIGRLEEYRLHEDGRYRVHAYELKSFDVMPITRDSQVMIHAGGVDKYALVKIGVEDHYRLQITDGTPIYRRPRAVFNVNNGPNNFICHNIIFSPVHRQHNGGVISGINLITSGNKPEGVIAVIGARTYAELNQIGDTENGATGITKELLALSSVLNGRVGIYSGEGLARRAATTVTQAFIDSDFMGSGAFGASTANGDGCNMVYIDTTGDFNPQTRWGNTVNDYEGYVATDLEAYQHAPPSIRQARMDGWYPTDVLTPTTAANMLVGLAMGGSNRYNILNVARFIFLKNNPGNRNLLGYYNVAYNRSGIDFDFGRAGFRSTSYDILQHEVPRTAKNYVISRHYGVSTRTYDWRSEHGAQGLSPGDRFSYLTGYNNPMSMVSVDDPDGFNANDTVVSQDIAKRIVAIEGNDLLLIDSTGRYTVGEEISNDQVTAVITGFRRSRLEIPYPRNVHPHTIRMDTCWTTIMQSFAENLDPLQIPSKGRGVAIQAGDQFRILPFILVEIEEAVTDVDLVRGGITGNRSGATANISSFLRTYDIERTQADNSETPYYQVNLTDMEGTFVADEEIEIADGTRTQRAIIRRVSSHDPDQVHTSMGLERVAYPESPAEFVGSAVANAQAYYSFYNVCEEELPADIPLTMEIQVVKSNAEYLLDPDTSAKIRQKYIGNGRVGGHYAYSWPAGRNLWQQDNEWGSGSMHGEGSIPGHFAYSQVHHYWYFLRTDFNYGFWRQNYRKPAQETITFEGREISVIPLQFYSRGHVLINCKRPMVGQFSSGDEGAQNFDRRRILEDYLAEKGVIEPVPEEERAKLMSFGGDEKANTGYRYSYVREETTEDAPRPPQDLLDLLEEIGVSVLPLDRETETVEDRYTGRMAGTGESALEAGRDQN